MTVDLTSDRPQQRQLKWGLPEERLAYRFAKPFQQELGRLHAVGSVLRAKRARGFNVSAELRNHYSAIAGQAAAFGAAKQDLQADVATHSLLRDLQRSYATALADTSEHLERETDA
ncbi:MAG: hypothetical protein ABL879_10955 [Devosia sp.]